MADLKGTPTLAHTTLDREITRTFRGPIKVETKSQVHNWDTKLQYHQDSNRRTQVLSLSLSPILK